MSWRPRRRVWQWITLTLQFAIAGSAFIAAAVIGYEQSDFELGNWMVTDRQRFWSVLIAALLALAGSFWRITQKLRGKGEDAAQARVQQALFGAMAQVSSSTGIPIEDLGTSVFVPATRWRLPRAGGEFQRPREKVLTRVSRVRLRSTPQPTRIWRTKGKGATGECWATEIPVHRDWLKQASAKVTKPEDLETELTEQQVDGYDYAEFVRIQSKYAEVLAVPVVSEAAGLMAVVSIDVVNAPGRDVCELDDVEVQAAFEAAAVLLRSDIGNLYPVE